MTITDPKPGQPIFLSWTAAKRYEQCGFLQLAHKAKAVKKAPNELPFFKGRVLHDAAEQWLLRRGTTDIQQLIPWAWSKNEAEVVQAGTVIWSAEERAAVHASAVELATTLQAMLRAMRITELPHLVIEQKFNAWVGQGAAMYAQADILALSPDGQTGYLGELKSGKSYDPGQPPWYIAVIGRQPQYADVRQWFALPIRPAVASEAKLVAVGADDVKAQVDRALAIVDAMHRGEWEPKQGYYCNTCEARNICPSYQAAYGHITKGKVGLGPL